MKWLRIALIFASLSFVTCKENTNKKNSDWDMSEFRIQKDMFIVDLKVSSDGNYLMLAAIKDEKTDFMLMYMLYKFDGKKWKHETNTSEFYINKELPISFSFSISSNGRQAVCNSGINSDSSVYLWERMNGFWNMKKILSNETDSNLWRMWDIKISGDGNTLMRSIRYTFSTTNKFQQNLLRVYQKSELSWIETTLLNTSTPTNDYVGHFATASVSYDGRKILAGTSLEKKDGVRKAFVFEKFNNKWKAFQITNNYYHTYDAFGVYVSISGDGTVAALGAPYDDEKQFNSSGAVFIYRWDESSWKESKIVSSDGERSDRFGQILVISGNGKVLYVSALSDDNENGINAGAIYRYRWSGSNWIEEDKLISPRKGKMSDLEFGLFLSTTRDGNVLFTSEGDNPRNRKIWIFKKKVK